MWVRFPPRAPLELFKIKIYAPLAQLVEQIPLKDKVEGSIPSGRTKVLMHLLRDGGTKVPSRGREKIQQNFICDHNAGVAELVYALVLGTNVARLEGSSPSSSTRFVWPGRQVVRQLSAKELYVGAIPTQASIIS